MSSFVTFTQCVSLLFCTMRPLASGAVLNSWLSWLWCGERAVLWDIPTVFPSVSPRLKILILPPLREFYLTIPGKKTVVENWRHNVPNFINDEFISSAPTMGHVVHLVLPLQFSTVPDPQNFINFQKLWGVRRITLSGHVKTKSTTVEKKLLENFRCIVPNFNNDWFI
jgi:hypothetical protein